MSKQLITSPQALTASFVDLGVEQQLTQYTRIAIWLNVDINDSLNVRFRALGKLAENDTNEFSLPIKTVTSTQVTIEEEFVELGVDADQLIIFEVLTNGLVPFVQFQVSAGTVGASPGEIDEAFVTFSDH